MPVEVQTSMQYQQRLQRVIDYIYQHLSEELTLEQLASISVPADTKLNPAQPGAGQLQYLELPSGTTVSLLFQGDYAQLEQPDNWLFGQWLPHSGEELADFPPFEEYLNDVKDTPPAELLTQMRCYLKR